MPRKYLDKLKGSLVLVVGGSAGIGFAVAEAAVEHGANVVIASRSQARIDDAVHRLKASYPDHPGTIRGHTCNLRSAQVEAEIAKLYEFATENGKTPIDHLVDTAGEFPTSTAKPIEDSDRDTWLEAFHEHFTGTALLASHALKHMHHASTSSITLTSGVLVSRPMKGMSSRIPAGGAKQTLTHALAVDMAPIRVNIVVPGAINTESLQDMFKAMGGGPGPEERFRGMSLLNAIGEVEDVAESYLCSMKNRFVTGTVLNCEGGFFLKL